MKKRNDTKRIKPILNRLPLLALMLVATLLGSVAVTVSAQPPTKVKVLIAFTHQPGPAEQALVRGVGGDIKYTYHLVPAIAASVPEAALDGLRRNPHVSAVEPDIQAQVIDTELDNAWGVQHIGAGLVHAAGNRGARVRVGILDTGIDLDHSDLAYDPDCSQSFVDGESLDDGHSHGTHVAGTVAALDNDTGVVGVAPEATLCIYKVFNNSGSGNYSDVIAALERAVADGVQVTNNSYGSSSDPGPTVEQAFYNASIAGLLHVAAAGNYGNFDGTGENCIYPARWDSVIATAATTQSDSRASFSSTCPEVELAAPGDLIYSTWPGGGYGYKNGTSMASPHLAGTAALVWAANPDWSNAQIRTQLQTTANDLGDPGRDPWYGFGLVDAVEATAPNNGNNPPLADDQAVTTAEDTPVAVTLTGSDPEDDPLTFNVTSTPSHGSLSGTAPNLTYTPAPNFNGVDSFTFVANDGQANSNTAIVSITVNPVNDTPLADNQTVLTNEDTPVAVTLTATDVDGDPLTFNVVSGPSNGSLNGTVPNLTYTPDVNFNGTDGFNFITNDGAADSNLATVSITVNPVNDPPLANDLAVTTNEDTPVAVTLTGSDVDGDPLTFNVTSSPLNGNLGGTAPDLTYTPNPNFNGSDSCTFIANDGQADSTIATVSITIEPVNDPPSAVFSSSCTGLSCDFDASGSSDPEGVIAGYAWDFGDGNAGSGPAPSHSYAAGGTYSVALTVTDDGGASDTDVQAISVSEVPPSMHIGDLDGNQATANKNFWWAEVTITVHDQDESRVAEATVQGTWSGGAAGSGSCLSGTDGTCTVLSPKIPAAQQTIAFRVDGVAHATLPYQAAENHDPDGDSDGTTIEVLRSGNQPPLAYFSYDCSGLACTFDGSGSADPDGSIVSYVWDFGDGNSSSGVTADHTYAAPGTYTVLLTITDDGGAADTESQNVPVSINPGTMFVFDITMSGKAAGPNRSATAVVTIYDTNNSPVAGATVYGTWSGDYNASVSGVTAADGTAVFASGKVRQANATFTFTADNVERNGFTYDPGLNTQSSATLVVP